MDPSPAAGPGDRGPPPELAARLASVEEDIRRGLLRRRRPLLRRLARLRRRPRPRELEALAREAAASRAAAEARRAALPRPRYPEGLPVVAHREAILEALSRHQVVILCGETGSGKSTQLPKLCLELGLGAAGLVGHTQPRRLAARSVAARIAEELGTPLGELVGYQVRFNERLGPRTAVKVMTDGILLAEIPGDPLLERYEALILDEAHERSLNIDFLLGYLKRILPRRPDLKLIVASATLDAERFAAHFDGAPVLSVAGRSHPVAVRYRPLNGGVEGSGSGGWGEERALDLPEGVAAAVEELAREGPGDVLVFLPGEREIRECAELLRRRHPPQTEILPLYARLSAAEQDRIFHPRGGGRRVILATNVAETSLTVPGIRYVVDSGLARIARYSHRSKVQRLPVEPVSQASARQRAGRCGRLGPGICIRLYAEEDLASRPAYTDPEILRSNLAAVVLRMEALGLGRVEDFPFLDPPDPRLVRDAYHTLRELGAVDARGRLTGPGRELARLPVDPRLGRMILAAREEGCLREVLVIAAALAVQDPRERPHEAREAADRCHRQWEVPGSDFLAFLRLWEAYHEQARHLSRSALRRWCRERHLSFLRMRDWHDTHQQLLALIKDRGWRPNEAPAEPERIHRALLAGLLSQVGMQKEGREYLGARGGRFHLFPGSALHRRPPRWVMSAEIVETSRRYARLGAAIDPAWLEAVAPPDLLRRSHGEPWWSKDRGAALVPERVTLYGLPVVERREVACARVDPAAARALFIREALVGEGWKGEPLPFLAHNRRLLAELAELEHRARRADILAEEESLCRFYDERLPPEVVDVASCRRWWRRASEAERRALHLTREALLRREPGEVTAERFPEALELGGLRLPLRYRFEPGHPEDGVTLQVPVAVLNQLRPAPLSWLVPGLLREKVEALLRGLPKALRRHCVPVPDFARACLEALEGTGGARREEPLTEALARELRRMTGVEVPPEAWREETLPEHLRLRLEVVDEQGRVLGAGRDLEALRAELGGRARASFARLPREGLERTGLRAWTVGPVPERVELEAAGAAPAAVPAGVPLGYPALVPEADGTVALRVLDEPEEARRAHRRGVLRLLRLALGRDGRYLERQALDLRPVALQAAAVGGAEALARDLLEAVLERAFLAGREAPRDPEAFARCLEEGRPRLLAEAERLRRAVAETLELHHRLRRRLEEGLPPAWLAAARDLDGQLRRLVRPGFVARTPDPWLGHLPRYLRAALRRLERLELDPARDRRLMAQVAPHWERYLRRVPDPDAPLEAFRSLPPAAREALERYRWMVEELRVSLFAQELRTAMPVSPQRLQAQWREVERLAGGG